MFLGFIVLVSTGFSVHLSQLSAFVSRSRLTLARSATPSGPCYRRLGLQFTVEENFSTGYSRFLHSLYYLWRLPSQTHTGLPIVSTVLGSSPPPPPPSFIRLLGYSYNPLLSAGTLTANEDPRDLPYGHTPWLRFVVVLHCLGGRCQRLGFFRNVLHGQLGFSWLYSYFLRPPASPVVILQVLGSSYNIYFLCWCLRQGFSC